MPQYLTDSGSQKKSAHWNQIVHVFVSLVKVISCFELENSIWKVLNNLIKKHYWIEIAV